MPEPEKELPVATIDGIKRGEISLRIEMDGIEQVFPFRTTDKVDTFVAKYPQTYKKGAVVEFSAHGGLISLIRKAKGFQKATVQTPHVTMEPPSPTTSAEIKPEVAGRMVLMESETKANSTFVSPTSSPQSPLQGVATAPQVPLAISKEAVNIKTIGSFDPEKIKGYEITDTCQVTQYEPITIKVICDDPEEGRKALIEAWGSFGQYTDVTRDIVYNHIKTHLMRDIRV